MKKSNIDQKTLREVRRLIAGIQTWKLNIKEDETSTTSHSIQVQGGLSLYTSGDIDKLPGNDSLFGKSFLQHNNQYINSGYEKNASIISDILSYAPGIKRILNNLQNSTQYELVYPKGVLEKLQKGELKFLKSSENIDNLLPSLKEIGTKGIKHQVRIRQVDLSKVQIDNLLSAGQMMAIQQSLGNISSQIEALDTKLKSVLIGAQFDRLAHIQSGYNLYLQTRVNEKFKDSLYPHIISQLNLGREQLIYSLKYDLQQISENNQKSQSFTAGFFSDKDLVNSNRQKYDEIQQSLRFIIRSTQLLAIIYQEMDEKWSMMQAVITLKEVLNNFNQENKDLLVEWSQNDAEAEQMFKNISETYKSIDRQWISLTSETSELKLKININGIQGNKEEELSLLE